MLAAPLRRTRTVFVFSRLTVRVLFFFFVSFFYSVVCHRLHSFIQVVCVCVCVFFFFFLRFTWFVLFPHLLTLRNQHLHKKRRGFFFCSEKGFHMEVIFMLNEGLCFLFFFCYFLFNQKLKKEGRKEKKARSEGAPFFFLLFPSFHFAVVDAG